MTPQDDRTNADDRTNQLEEFYRLRDRIAYGIYLRKDLGKKLALGLAFGIAFFLLGQGMDLTREWGKSPGWRARLDITYGCLLVTLLTAFLGFLGPWYGGLCFFFGIEVLTLLYVPEIFGLLTFLVLGTFLVWLVIRPGKGAMVGILTIPVLDFYWGLGALAPLGFACFYPFGKAVWLTAAALVWMLSVGLWTGSQPRFDIHQEAFLPKEELLTLTQVNQFPWSSEIVGANLDQFKRAFDALLFGETLPIRPFLLQLVLAMVVIWIVKRRHHSVKYKDRLALEFLSKEGQAVAKDDLAFFRQPIGIGIGAAIWIVFEIGVSLMGTEVYPVEFMVGDFIAASIVTLMVLFHYHGDPALPMEYSHAPQPASARKDPSGAQIKVGSGFGVAPITGRKLEYPSAPKTKASQMRDPSNVRLKSWKDRVDLDWEGTLPDGTKVRFGGETAGGKSGQEASQTAPSAPENVFEEGGIIDGQYRIKRSLTGGMGIVYIVTDEFSGVEYAVKTLRDDLRNNEEAVDRFTTESKTWIRLGRHSNIVQALFYRVTETRPLLFLEYIDGTDLEEIFSRPGPRPTVMRFVDWGVQFCEGMRYANEQDLGSDGPGFVHRDIKPGNIMLEREGCIKITDFGLAKVADAPSNLTRESVGLGTLKYMAPEQVKDAKHVDSRADIYSFGAVLYEGLSGRPPFVEDASIDLYMAVLSKQPPPLVAVAPGVPPELDHIVMRCLHKDREQRYSSFEELAWALRRFGDRHTEGPGSSHIRVVS